MRARLALFKAEQTVRVREVKLSNKPAAMLVASAKGTVPTLVFTNELGVTDVIDESLEVMLWALQRNDPNNLLQQQDSSALAAMLDFITRFDNEFKTRLNAYKCAKRYREDNLVACRQACELFIQELEERLTINSPPNIVSNKATQTFIFNGQESLVDIALMPFIRQFSKVERQWYQQSPYPKVRQWLNHYLQSVMFTKVMTQYEVWQAHDR
jgi:glutathione S-transferase